MPTFEIADDQRSRTFASLAEAQAAHQADEDEAWRRMKEGMRREHEREIQRGVELERERLEAQRASLGALLAEARLGPGQAEAALREAIAEGRLEDALAAALRLVAMPLVLEAAEAILTVHARTPVSVRMAHRGEKREVSVDFLVGGRGEVIPPSDS